MSMVSESPWSSFVRVSDVIFKYLETHNAKVLHSKIACFSSSILLLEQYLHSLEVTGVTGLVYLPDSIPRFGTALTRYLVSQARRDLFVIFKIYGSWVKELTSAQEYL